MTDETVRRALSREASAAPAADDLWSRTQHRIRQRRRRRWGGGAASLLLVAAGVGGVIHTLPGLSGGEVELADGGETVDVPSTAEQEDESGQTDESATGPPEEWQRIEAGDVAMAVPPDWHVVDVGDYLSDPATADVGPRVDDGLCPWPEDAPVALVLSDEVDEAPCPDEQLPSGVVVNPVGEAVADEVRPLVRDGQAVIDADRVDRVEEGDGRSLDHEAQASGDADGASDPGEAFAEAVQRSPYERTQIGDLAVLAAEEAPRPHDDDRESRAVLLPGLEAAVVGVADSPDELTQVEEVLATLRPAEGDADGVVLFESWPAGTPMPDQEDGEPFLGQLFALDADAQLHQWHEVEATTGGEAPRWQPAPGATSEAFAGLWRLDGEARLVAARPGEDAVVAAAYDDNEAVPKPDAWHPAEAAFVRIDRRAQRARLWVWEDMGALADGREPVVDQEVDVEGAAMPDEAAAQAEGDAGGVQGPGSLGWGDGDVLVDRSWGQSAEVERDAAGRLRLPEPLRFTEIE